MSRWSKIRLLDHLRDPSGSGVPADRFGNVTIRVGVPVQNQPEGVADKSEVG
jgi:hypothetical protein